MKKGIAFILTVFLMLTFFGCSSEPAGSTVPEEKPGEDISQSSEPAGSTLPDEEPVNGILYRMKINPEFEISADDDLIVAGVTAVNADAESVLASVDVLGLSVNEAFSALAEEAKAQGFLTAEKGNTVQITILEKDDEIMPTCHLCGGCGTVECLECHGTGILGTCGLCLGAGEFHCDECGDSCWIVCPECHGTAYCGYTQEYIDQAKNMDPPAGCWNCHGSGVCSYCNGAGYEIVTNGHDGSVKYQADGTPETSTCISCKGTGVCSNCIGSPTYEAQHEEMLRNLENSRCWLCNDNGNGEKPGYICCPHTGDPDFLLGQCPECGGAGIMYCNDSFNGFNWCPCCWGSGVEGTGDPDYRDDYPDPTA